MSALMSVVAGAVIGNGIAQPSTRGHEVIAWTEYQFESHYAA